MTHAAPPIVRTDHGQIGAFFDMDKTIIAENSASLFMQYRYAQGEIGNLELIVGVDDGDRRSLGDLLDVGGVAPLGYEMDDPRDLLLARRVPHDDDHDSALMAPSAVRSNSPKRYHGVRWARGAEFDRPGGAVDPPRGLLP